MNGKRLLMAAVLLSAFIASGCSQQRQQENKPKTETTAEKAEMKGKKMEPTKLTTEMFKQRVMDFEANPTEWKFRGERPAIIDFYATWCGPCRQMSPTVDKIAEEYAGKIDVYKVDVDEEEQLAAMFGIQSIPTLLFIPKAGDPQKSVGVMSKGQFDEAIKNVLLK